MDQSEAVLVWNQVRGMLNQYDETNTTRATTMLEYLVPKSLDSHEMVFTSKLSMAKQRIESSYLPFINNAIQKILGSPRDVVIVVQEETEQLSDPLVSVVAPADVAPTAEDAFQMFAPAYAAPTVSSGVSIVQPQQMDTPYTLAKQAPFGQVGQVTQVGQVAQAVAQPAAQPAPFSSPGTHTFDNFVVGDSNDFAYSAASAVAELPGKRFNPFFIYGASGLGKTHLLHAIRNELARTKPQMKILYIGGEQFTNELIAAIASGSTEAFHDKYRSVDVLLVDDVQFIGGKEATQEEFFHTFNALHNHQKQIVLTSDRPPKEIKSLEERLRTRFEWGLLADVQPPDVETRISILFRKAEVLGLELPVEVADFIANMIKSDVRQLEGVIKKLNAYYQMDGIVPSIGMAQNTIRDIMAEQQPIPVTVEKILGEVARTFSVSPEDIRSTKQHAAVSAPRQIAMYILREVTGMTMEKIGQEFGGRNHATVVYAISKVEKQLENDTRTRELVEDIIKNSKN